MTKVADMAYPIAVGAPSDIFTGRRITTVSGHNLDPTRTRGYGRSMKGSPGERPGALTPRTSRVGLDIHANSNVGTNLTRDNLARIRAQWESSGPVGTRTNWFGARPKHVGLNPRARAPMSDTPAMGVFRSSVAATGGAVRLGGYVVGQGNAWPADLQQFDRYPVPAPPVGRFNAMDPVACLPGGGGCSGRDPGSRTTWGHTQNTGQAKVSTYAPGQSPLPSYGDHPLSVPSSTQPIDLPLAAPGSRHVVAEDGSASYFGEAAYPSQQTPFGYKGGSRVPDESQSPGGKTISKKPAQRAMLVAGIAAAGVLVFLSRKRSR